MLRHRPDRGYEPPPLPPPLPSRLPRASESVSPESGGGGIANRKQLKVSESRGHIPPYHLGRLRWVARPPTRSSPSYKPINRVSAPPPLLTLPRRSLLAAHSLLLLPSDDPFQPACTGTPPLALPRTSTCGPNQPTVIAGPPSLDAVGRVMGVLSLPEFEID